MVLPRFPWILALAAVVLAAWLLRTRPTPVPASRIAPEVCERNGVVQSAAIYDGVYRVQCSSQKIEWVSP